MNEDLHRNCYPYVHLVNYDHKQFFCPTINQLTIATLWHVSSVKGLATKGHSHNRN